MPVVLNAHGPRIPAALARGTCHPIVTIAQISSSAPAMAPPMRIGFSRLVLRTLAIDVAVLIAPSFSKMESAGKSAAAKWREIPRQGLARETAAALRGSPPHAL